MEDGVIDSLIKRETGPFAGKGGKAAPGTTLGEKLAAQREEAARAARGDDAPAESVAPAPPAARAAPVDDHEAIVAAAKRARDGGGEAGRPAKRQCLVVDDSRVVRRVSRGIAESLGYTVVEAENGEEALARCRKVMPDLILTDWQMPVMSGIEFVQTLRRLPSARSATVVFCTSKGDVQDIHEGIAAGADDYVLKPFDEATLKAKLAKLKA